MTQEYSQIEKILRKILRGIFPQKNQAISMPNIYGLVYAQLDSLMQTDGIWRALIDVYLDGADMFAVIGMEGLLYKSMLTLGKGSVTLGELTQVEVDYKPVTQGKALRVLRQADGKYRWFAFPASVAVLNRSGELDSRELFHSFVNRIESGEAEYPFLSFYHVGERITLGQADYAAVDGYEYLLSGTFGDDPLSQAARRAIEENPEYYGLSIGFYYMPEAVEQMVVSDGITIPVYSDGINYEVSLLAEKDAASLYTGIFVQEEGVKRMNEKVLSELKKLAGSDPEALKMVDELASKVDAINTDIEGKNLVRREQENTPAPETPAPVTPDAPVTPTEPAQPAQEMVLDEGAMNALAERVAQKVGEGFAEQITRLNDALNATQTQLNSATQAMQTASDEHFAQLEARLTKLEKPLAEQVKQALNDMPRAVVTNVTYRPTNRQAEEEPEDQGTPLEEIANSTLALLK